MKKLDILLLTLFPIIAVILSLVFKLNFLISTLLFFGLPSIYLSFRTSKGILRALIFSLFFGLIPGLVIGHIGVLDKDWYTTTIFPFRIFGTLSVEEIIWIFLLVYFIVIFYEHFIDKGRHRVVDGYFKILGIALSVIFIIFFVLILVKSSLLQIKYVYMRTGLSVIPVIILVLKHPHFFFKLLKISPYFIAVSLINLLTGVELGHWYYPGNNFIGMASVFNYKIPYEEFLLFVLLFSTVVIGYFEFFDDRKHLDT